MINFYDQINTAAQFILSQIQSKKLTAPSVAMVLGSGLGKVTEDAEILFETPYQNIPHFPVSSVAGHAGKLILGRKNGVLIWFFSGRRHYYEDGNMANVAFAVRMMKCLGVKTVILSSACGSTNPNIQPADVVVLTDHINLSGANVLIGANDDRLGPRFPDMTHPYDRDLAKLFMDAARSIGSDAKSGVLAGMSGPSYETAAEIRMLGMLGADVVTMSMVNEVIAARHAGLRVVGLACVTNMGTGLSSQPLSHDEVMEVSELLSKKVNVLIAAVLPQL